MFQIGFVPLVLVWAAIGFKLYNMALVEPPMGPLIEQYRKTCSYAETNPFYDFICVIEPFFMDLMSNDIGKSFMTAFGTSGAVMSTYLFIKGGERGGSLLFSPLITIAHTLAGQVFGAGIVGPIVLPALLAISKSLTPARAAAPSSPTYSYTVALLVMQFTVFLISTALSSLPPTHANWIHVNYAFQAFPFLFLPLAFFPSGSANAQKSTPTPTLSVSAFTVFKYLYGPLWWVALAQGLNAYFRQGQAFSLPCYFIALDFIGFTLAFVGMYAVDTVAGEAPMSVPRLVLGLLGAGPASTMASYFEAKQRVVVERAEAERTKKV
ncbi:hypothetical protein B0H19DRAFT_1196970 [Mycena capillaripes]|nr:hypothetical protein B0H19DRAFT_1196970 [Mycena capillaripes]